MKILKRFTLKTLLTLTTLTTLLTSHADVQILAGGPALTQVSSMVTPRSYVVCSNMLMTNGQGFFTGTITNTSGFNSYFGPSFTNYLWLTNQPVAFLAPTMLPPMGTHHIGLQAYITMTNGGSGAGNTNLQIKVYPAFDTTGSSSASATALRYGQFFDTNDLLYSVTLIDVTNMSWGTNLLTTVWEPATSLGYTISNNASVNVWLTLVQTDTP